MNPKIAQMVDDLKKEILGLETIEEKAKTINFIKENISEASPFIEPVDCVRWVKSDKVKANSWNPNKVASPEMKLLYESIRLDGYTQPIVAYRLDDGLYEVVDGFHRNRIGKEYSDIKSRLKGYLPVVVIDKPVDERMGSTIRHNRARGTHQIRSMSDIVLELSKDGWSDSDICKKLGMDLDEVIRLKQITGLKEAFANHEFSKSWEEYEKRRQEEAL